MRLLFSGTPEIAVPTLSLLSAHHDVVAVLTAPDTRSGRGRELTPSPVKQRALEIGLPVLQPQRLGAALREELRPYAAELLVCVAYGRIFGPLFLALFPRGGINLHPSLLPRYRGPAPIPAAILAGDRETGVSVQALAREVDAGAIYLQKRIDLHGAETTGSLTETAGDLGAHMVLDVVDQLESGSEKPVPQDPAAATFTSILSKDDGRIDWSSSAEHIERMVRAYSPWPLAHTSLSGLRLNILHAAVPPDNIQELVSGRDSVPGTVAGVDKSAGILIQTGNGLLSVQKLQLQNKKPLDWKSFLNGVRSFPGTLLGG